MEYLRLIEVIFERFERLLRWLYPGLLFYAIFPFAIKNVTVPSAGVTFSQLPHGAVYGGMPVVGHLGLVVASGFLTYLLVRYFLHEMFLFLLFFCRIGLARNFRRCTRWYPWATGGAMWERFGQRQTTGEAELKFDRYLVSRWAAVHALGSSWVLAVSLWGTGQVRGASALGSIPLWGDFLYFFVTALAVAGWCLQVIIGARAEQDHYTASAEV